MGAEIDRLELQVEAQATKANNQLDKLVGKLDAVANSLSHINTSGLTGLANGVQKFAQASLQLSSVKTADFTRLTKNIDKLSALNTQQIFSTSSAITTLSKAVGNLSGNAGTGTQVAELASGIGKLGGANVQKAVANLPVLASALNDFMTTMSNAPAVSQKVIMMTNALANLAAQGNRVGAAGRGLTQIINNAGNSEKIGRFTNNLKGISFLLRDTYRLYVLFQRAAGKVWTSIDSSMSYVETLNYFDAAYGQVAEKAVSQWADMGAASAEEYYNSFSKRAKELTSKMTGFTVNDDGTLTATGQASLGINPNQLMNYQAMFAQMSSSMGIASETSLKLSQVLTEIGGDLASVKNMDFDKVWQDMASGLAGMSRTLDKYGVNIRNVNLQQRLMELGIDANITALNQNDKALLRAIILLDSTRYAWGDLADTINQPANQIRLLESNWANLSRTIGNIFLPVVAKVLPYVNGLVIAVQRLFTWIGSMLGLDLSQITSTVGSSDFDFGDLIGGADDLTDSLNDASKAADKLKKGIRAFDELNVITTNDDSGSSALGNLGGIGTTGLLDAAFDDIFNEYQEKWDEAFAKMQNKANEIADKIEQFFQPLKDIFNDFAAGDFFKAGQDTSKLVAGIFNFFADAIDRVDWYRIGQKVGDFIAGIDWFMILKAAGRLFWETFKAVLEFWAGSFTAAPLETSIITAIGLLKFTGLGKLVSGKIIKELTSVLGVEGTFMSVGAVFKTTLGKSLLTALTSVGGIGGLLTEDIGLILGAGTAAEIGLTIGTAIIGGIAAAFVGWHFGQWIEEKLTGEKIDMTFTEQIQGIIDAFKTNDAGDALKLWAKDLKDGWIKIGESIAVGSGLANKVFNFKNWYEKDVSPYFDRELWNKLGESMKSSISEKWAEYTAWYNGDGTSLWWSNIESKFSVQTWNAFGSNVKDSLSTKWGEFTSWFDNTGFATWWKGVQEKFSRDKWIFNGIQDGLTQAWNNAIEGIKSLWNRFAVWLNEKLVFEWDAVTILGQEIVPAGSIKLGEIPTFSIGGFPEDGLFMANHGELVGQFSNGKTAVANNEQIIAGIEEAAYRGMARALSESGGNANVDIHVDGDPHGMFRVWKDEWRSESERLQKNPVKLY